MKLMMSRIPMKIDENQKYLIKVIFGGVVAAIICFILELILIGHHYLEEFDYRFVAVSFILGQFIVQLNHVENSIFRATRVVILMFAIMLLIILNFIPNYLVDFKLL